MDTQPNTEYLCVLVNSLYETTFYCKLILLVYKSQRNVKL